MKKINVLILLVLVLMGTMFLLFAGEKETKVNVQVSTIEQQLAQMNQGDPVQDIINAMNFINTQLDSTNNAKNSSLQKIIVNRNSSGQFINFTFQTNVPAAAKQNLNANSNRCNTSYWDDAKDVDLSTNNQQKYNNSIESSLLLQKAIDEIKRLEPLR